MVQSTKKSSSEMAKKVPTAKEELAKPSMGKSPQIKKPSPSRSRKSR